MAQPSIWSKIKALIHEMKMTGRKAGIKGLYQRYGFKLFLAFFVYYLVRDVTLYILIPWWIAKKTILSP